MADTKLSALPSATLGDTDEVYINDGGASKKATIAELRTALNPKGFIMLDITSLREIASDIIQNLAAHGGVLASDSVPALTRTSGATDGSLRVTWLLAEVDQVQFPSVPMPPDLDETVDVTIHLVAESGSTDTPVFNVEVYDGVGDTEMGGNTGATADAITEVTVTIANANISGHPTGFFNISLIPAAHGTDSLHLYAAWIEYTRKLPA